MNCNVHTADPTSPDYIPSKGAKTEGRKANPVSFAMVSKTAIEKDCPCVVYVNYKAPYQHNGAISCTAEELKGYSPHDIVVCVPIDGTLYWVATYKEGQVVTIPKKQMVCNGQTCSMQWVATTASTQQYQYFGSNCGPNGCGQQSFGGGCQNGSCGQSFGGQQFYYSGFGRGVMFGGSCGGGSCGGGNGGGGCSSCR